MYIYVYISIYIYVYMYINIYHLQPASGLRTRCERRLMNTATG